jgi:hypothetical protein
MKARILVDVGIALLSIHAVACATVRAEERRYDLCPYEAGRGLKELTPALREFVWKHWAAREDGRVLVTQCDKEGFKSSRTISVVGREVRYRMTTPPQPGIPYGQESETIYDSVEKIAGPGTGEYRVKLRDTKSGAVLVL